MVNYRLLKYPLDAFDYNKINNKSYLKRNYNKLLLNYYFSKSYNLSKTIILAKKRCGANWFKIIVEIGLGNTIKKEFNLELRDKTKILNYAYGNKCIECNLIIAPLRHFCSNKCSNSYKVKDPKYIKKLSESIKNSYHKIDKEKKNKIISNSVKKFNKNLPENERKHV